MQLNQQTLNRHISFEYFLSGTKETSLDNEHSKVKRVEINGLEGDYFEGNSVGTESILVWNNVKYTCILVGYNYQKLWQEEDLIKIANNIKMVSKAR